MNNNNGKYKIFGIICISFVVGLLSNKFIMPESNVVSEIRALKEIMGIKVSALDSRMVKIESAITGIQGNTNIGLSAILKGVNKLISMKEKS